MEKRNLKDFDRDEHFNAGREVVNLRGKYLECYNNWGEIDGDSLNYFFVAGCRIFENIDPRLVRHYAKREAKEFESYSGNSKREAFYYANLIKMYELLAKRSNSLLCKKTYKPRGG